MDSTQKLRQYRRENPDFRQFESPKILENKIVLSVLKDLKNRVENLQERISNLEKGFGNTSNLSKDYPERNRDIMIKPEIYSEIKELNSRIEGLEKRFDEEIQEGEEVIERILSEVKRLTTKPGIQTPEETLTIVEKNRIEKIISLLEKHEKLSSSELSRLIGLSRTRCSEYLKIMENLGTVDSERIKRKKFYRLNPVN